MSEKEPHPEGDALTPTPGGAKTVPLPRLSSSDTVVPESDHLEGLRLGPYLLLKKLGAGGFGAVYHSRHETLGRDTAIKILFPHYAADAAFVARFKREARAAARMEHPGIVQVYDVGEDRGYQFIAMQFVDGLPLERLIENRGKLKPNEAISIGKRVAAALEFAHGHGVVHRDVKPGNILITKDSKVKVVDFGLARDLVETGGGVSQTGQVLGTPHYMSPEQGRGDKVDERSDVYSLGATLYSMVTGRVPFDGSNAISVILKHASEAVVPPIQLDPSIPRPLSDLIVSMMAKETKGRPQHMADVVRALEGMKEGRSVVISAVPAPPSAGRRRRIAIATGVGFVLVTGVIVGLVLANRKKSPKALFDQATAFAHQHPTEHDQAAARYREVIARSAAAPELQAQAQALLARALLAQADALAQAHPEDRGAAAHRYREVVDSPGVPPEVAAEARAREARIHLDAATAAAKAGRSEDALAACREVIALDGAPPETVARAHLLVYQGLRGKVRRESDLGPSGKPTAESVELLKEAAHARDGILDLLRNHSQEPWARPVWKELLGLEARIVKVRAERFLHLLASQNFTAAKAYLDPRVAEKFANDELLSTFFRSRLFKEGLLPTEIDVRDIGWPPALEDKIGHLDDAVMTANLDAPRIGKKRDLNFRFRAGNWYLLAER